MVLIIFPISSTTQESKKFIDLLYQIQDNFSENSQDMKTVVRLVNYAENFVPEFNVVGFFVLDKSVIFSLVANVATYIIILIQLEGIKWKH